LHIAIFTNCYLPLVNGVVGVVNLLRKGFLELGHEVSVFTPGYDSYVDEEMGIYRYPAADLTKKIKYPIAIPFSPKITKILRELDFDIIHSHHPFVLGPLALKLARRRKKPIVYTFHTQYDQYSHYVPLPSGLVNWFSKNQVRRFAQGVDQISTPAESAREVLLRYGVTNSIKIIPNPTDLTRFKRANGDWVKREYRLTTEKLLINIGRVAPEKNLELLLQSFRLMQAKARESIKLMIVGDGPALKGLKQFAVDLGIADAVIFTGMVEPSQIPDYLKAADLFVMTSKSEVKPLAQLEALAAGAPIVAVAAAGANDTITDGENGLLVAEDAEIIAQGVIELLSDPEQFARFKRNALDAAENYSYLRIAEEYLQLFNQVLQR
jgi:glycosyltransferase involved in cell wall biosynthesis